MIKSLLRNLEWNKREFRMLNDRHQQEAVGFLQEEQIKLLEILLALASKQDIANSQLEYSMSHIGEFVEYLVNTEFKGYMNCRTDNHQMYNLHKQTEIQAINQGKIKDLGIITMLAILRIDIFIS